LPWIAPAGVVTVTKYGPDPAVGDNLPLRHAPVPGWKRDAEFVGCPQRPVASAPVLLRVTDEGKFQQDPQRVLSTVDVFRR
jgi:hypothetical protein